MDEPTSSLDLTTEQTIITNILQAFPNKTIIVSLHRLILLTKFNHVIMLQNGNIIAMGETQTLIKISGPVKDLWDKYNFIK